MAATRTFKTTIYRDGSMCFIPVPFDPRPVFGKVRAPVVVTLNGYSYRSTIAAMGNGPCIPLRKSNREAAKLEGGETLKVTLALDTDKREVEAPAELTKALRAVPGALERFQALSYSHQREHATAIAEAKKPETRARRIEAAVKMIRAAPAKKPVASAKRAPVKKAATLAKAAPVRKPAPAKKTAAAPAKKSASAKKAATPAKKPTPAKRRRRQSQALRAASSR